MKVSAMALVAVTLLGSATAANAVLVFDFNAPLAGQPSINGAAPFARLTISDTAPNTVHFLLEHLVDPGNVDPSRFITSLNLNFAPFNAGISMLNASAGVSFSSGLDGFNDAGHRFDLEFGFPTPNGSRIEQGDSASWDLASTGLTESMFLVTAPKTNGSPSDVLAMIHMQGIGAGAEGSTKLVSVVPEPASLTAFGLLALPLLKRRRKK